MASSDNHSSSSSFKYDVFLSFRGTDTRHKFISHLLRALESKDVTTFYDDSEIYYGEQISEALLGAIKGSNFFIPVISQNYASSKWCLRELAAMLQCNESNDQILMPVFFHVDPSHVRHQDGIFKEAFSKYERDLEPEIQRWREAFSEVGSLKGWVPEEVGNGDESELVQSIVETVLGELKKTPLQLDVSEHLIALDCRIDEMLSLLSLESKDTRFVAICGMGGIGKTTLALAVYNKICTKFYGSSFLEVKNRFDNNSLLEVQNNKLVDLQKQLLYDILKEHIPIFHVHGGKALIKEKLQKKKVVLIVDDVDDLSQLEALAGNSRWFGPGSRIIITTRDMGVLNRVDNIKIHEAKGLNKKESLQLFCKCAFGQDQPLDEFLDLSNAVVSYAAGLPLTLTVLGSHLCGQNSEVWESELQKLRRIPDRKVLQTLKISFDGLQEMEQDMFLDIACFLVGATKESAVEMWNAIGFCPESGLQELIQKFLVKIDEFNIPRMHDQLQEMGTRIVCENNLTEPEKRSRLWDTEEIKMVLKGHMGTQKIKSIKCNLYWWWEEENGNFSFKDFETMSEIRIIWICDATIKGIVEHLSLAKLNYLKLVCVTLVDDPTGEAWTTGLQNKHFPNLKVLDLSECYFSKSPDFSGFPQLEKLILKDCVKLDEVHESIGQLRKLVHLNLANCVRLIKLPCSIDKLYSLKDLFLQYTKLEELPDSIGDLENPEKLNLSSTNILELPNLIGGLSKPEILSLNHCSSLQIHNSTGGMKSLVVLNLTCTKIKRIPNSIGNLSKLKQLRMDRCYQLKGIPDSIGGMTSLVELYLDSTLIEKIPNDIGLLPKLKELSIRHCRNLGGLPELPSSLICLDAGNCNALRSVPDLSNLKMLQTLKLPLFEMEWSSFGTLNSIGKLESLVTLNLYDSLIKEIPDAVGLLKNLKTLYVGDCQHLKSIPKLPSCLIFLSASNCKSLKRLPDLSNLRNLKTLLLNDCTELAEIEGLEGTESLEKLDISGCDILTYTKTYMIEMPDDLPFPESHKFVIRDDEINNGNSLFLGFELKYNMVRNGRILIKAQIHRKGKQILCDSDFHINGGGEEACLQLFQGPNWFVIPLKGEDEIEIVSITVLEAGILILKPKCCISSILMEDNTLF